MHKNDYREKFNKNNEVLKKLNIILDKTKNGVDTGFTEDTIKSAIEKINNEQNFYSKQMRKNMYQRFNGKIKLIPNYELYQPEFIERENEIIIQANSIDEYVTEVVENNQENEIEMSTTDKTCDDKTDVLTSDDKTCDDKTDVLTSVDKTCDDKTDVLTSDDKTCDDKTDVLTSSNKVNISKKKNKLNKFKVALANIAAAALLLIGGVGISGKLNKENNKEDNNSNDSHVEYMTEAPTEEITTIQEVEYEETTEEKDNIDNTLEIESTDNVIVTEFSNDIEDNNVMTETSNEENFDLKIGDVVSFKNADLYYSSTALTPVSNTDNLSISDCRVTMISIVYQKEVIDVITDENASVLEIQNVCQEKYGDDVKVFINSDVIDENENFISPDLGWIDITDDEAKSKVFK